MIYIYIAYSLSFSMVAAVLALHARAPIHILPRAPLWMLFLFALTHASYEWLQTLHFLERMGAPEMTPFPVDVLCAFLLPISFLCLLAFAVELLISGHQLPLSARRGYVAVTLAWTAWAVSRIAPDFFAISAWAPLLERASRLTLALPGTLLASFALWTFSRHPLASASPRGSCFARGSAVAMFTYGVAAGLAFLPSTVPIHSDLLALQPSLRLTAALVIVRLVSAGALSILLMEAFVVEVSRMQELASRSRQEFLSAVGHDMRSAVSCIDMATQLLGHDFSRAHRSDHDLELLATIRNGSNRLLKMISDFFDASLIDLSRIELRKRPTDVVQLVSKTARQRELITGRSIQLELPSRDLRANIDEARVEQVLDNLLSNAAKYSNPKSKIVCGLEPERQGIKIQVKSLGPPIPPEQAAHLFDRFYRATRKAGGTGLGLHIVKGLVDAHGGRVGVTSSENGLTTFDVWLPA